MKLSEFTGEKGIKIASMAMKPIFTLTTNEEIKKLRKQKDMTIAELLTKMIEYEPDAAIELYAILNEQDVEEYKKNCNAATMLDNIFKTFADEDLMVLFGLRVRETQTSSGLPTASTKAKKK